MKAMAILFRVVFSIIVLVLLACYLQMAPTVTLGEFYDSLNCSALAEMFSGVNAVTISLFIIVLLGVFSFTRILEALWNILFCASILLLLAGGLYVLGGAQVALPNAIYHNDFINSICQSITAYQLPAAITVLIFIAGWVCAPACGRIAATAVVSYGLWYALTEFFSYVVYLWANNNDPAMPEALNMIQSSPWIIAAVPAAFFLIYALLMAFFETFITSKPAEKKAKTAAGEKTAAAAETPAKEAAQPESAEKKPAAPAAKSQPILKTGAAAPVRKLKVAAPAAAEEFKAEPTPETKEKPAEETTMEEAPAEEAPAKEEAPAEVKPAEEAEAPAKEEAPVQETPAAEEAPKAEEEKPVPPAEA